MEPSFAPLRGRWVAKYSKLRAQCSHSYYGIVDRRNIYRHAHSTGLFARRSREVARIMEQYLEMVDHDPPDEIAPFDLDSVTRAIRVYSHLDQDGCWREPERTYHILTGLAYPQGPAAPLTETQSSQRAAAPSLTAEAALGAGAPNRHIPELESETSQ